MFCYFLSGEFSHQVTEVTCGGKLCLCGPYFQAWWTMGQVPYTSLSMFMVPSERSYVPRQEERLWECKSMPALPGG